jgi:hypothetical protein
MATHPNRSPRVLLERCEVSRLTLQTDLEKAIAERNAARAVLRSTLEALDNLEASIIDRRHSSGCTLCITSDFEATLAQRAAIRAALPVPVQS